MGERCTQRMALGQPAKLSRQSKDEICGACREQQRDSQVGLTKAPGHTRGAVSRVSSGSQTNEHGVPTQESTVGLPQQRPPMPQPELVAKVYERGGMPVEEWSRLCEQSGNDPDSDVLYVWENTEPAEARRDKTAACGKPGVASSGYALVCEKCWDRMRSGQAPRVCEPWDNAQTLPEERYGTLLSAARALLSSGMRAEEEIIPTLVWAAKSWELEFLQSVTGRFSKAGQGSEKWADLKGQFAGALGAFEPIRVIDGVLVLRWVPIAVTGIIDQETRVTETILIDVRRRSAKPEDVVARYQEYLRQKGIPHGISRGDVGFTVLDGVIRLSVRPEASWAYPMGRSPARPRREQLAFPEARLVQGMYAALKGSQDSRVKGRLFGREKGPPRKATNAILGTCAWYLGRRGQLIKNPSLRPNTGRILNRHLLEPSGLSPLAEGSWTSADTVWRDTEKLDPWVLRAEHELREAYLALTLSL